jgi:hypothetical protein
MQRTWVLIALCRVAFLAFSESVSLSAISSVSLCLILSSYSPQNQVLHAQSTGNLLKDWYKGR